MLFTAIDEPSNSTHANSCYNVYYSQHRSHQSTNTLFFLFLYNLSALLFLFFYSIDRLDFFFLILFFFLPEVGTRLPTSAMRGGSVASFFFFSPPCSGQYYDFFLGILYHHCTCCYDLWMNSNVKFCKLNLILLRFENSLQYILTPGLWVVSYVQIFSILVGMPSLYHQS